MLGEVAIVVRRADGLSWRSEGSEGLKTRRDAKEGGAIMMRTLGSLLRLAIMLSVLVAAPIAAVLGKPSFRKQTVQWFDRAIAGWSKPGEPGPAADASSEPKAEVAPLPNGWGDQPSERPAGGFAAAAQRLGAGPGPSTATGALPRPGGIAARSASHAGVDAASSTNVPASPAALDPPVTQPGPTANSAAPASPDGVDDLLLQLQRLGADYYRLEEWAGPPRVYRFVCRYAGDAGEESFEAVQSDPRSAVTSVLSQLTSRLRLADARSF